MKDFRYQIIPLTIPLATAANNLVEEDVELDRAFNRITGIAVTVVEDASLGASLLVGAKTNRKVWVDQVPINLWNADSGVSPNDKYLSVNIPYASKDVFWFQAVPLAALAAVDAELYMVLRLEADLTELPRQ
jgi:hypothetical protein